MSLSLGRNRILLRISSNKRKYICKVLKVGKVLNVDVQIAGKKFANS